MPVEPKPIFRPDVLRSPIARVLLPEAIRRQREKLSKWAEMIGSGAVDAHKEQEILGDFLNDVFSGLLGYTRAVDSPGRYTITREKHVQANGKFADAVLGEFGVEKPRSVVVLEGKGPKDPLDRPFGGRKLSAVDQAYDYAINLRANWLIVTSVRETRLYYKGADKLTFERFETVALASEDHQLRKFVFLLHADRVVPPAGPCHLDELLQDSEKVGRELTREFYGEYAFIRRSTFARLRASNPGVEPRHVLAGAQKLLDRVLFIAFCEDRGLLPPETIERAYSHRDPYTPRPLWDNFRGVFRAINEGRPGLDIPKYNGGLFADDPILDSLSAPDEVFQWFRDLAQFDFRSASDLAGDDSLAESRFIDVEILGHIFEKSIDDLEELRKDLDKSAEEFTATTIGLEKKPKASRRKREGAFYTPSFVTRYIVGQALGGALRDRFERLRLAHAAAATGTARGVMNDPSAYDLTSLNVPQRGALLAFWIAWQDELGTVRILDPSCGSGAFLIEAFDQLHAQYQRTNERVQELRGYAELFDLDRIILQQNLYGVDLNEEAVQTARLSLWIKTAVPGKVLTSLDHTIRVGNSIVSDPAFDSGKAFDWRATFPEVFGHEGRGGFDVVIGNPPYIRQEWISPIKSHLQKHYKVYDGAADLYVYFYELGLGLLKPGGRLSYIVTNKWLKAGYGEPLRRFFGEDAWVESVVDFGHAKQIFPDADVFPCIIVAQKPSRDAAPITTEVCAIPREQLRITDLNVQIASDGVKVDRRRLGSSAWNLEPRNVTDLLEKIRSSGVSIYEHTGVNPLSGIKTGFNEAFLIDKTTRDKILKQDGSGSQLIMPYLRGQDIDRWHPNWDELWMIAIKSSGDHVWPWTGAREESEEIFRRHYPGVYDHLLKFKDPLTKRKDQGYHWWEMRSCAYWGEFDRPKIMYQEITWKLQWCYDSLGTLCNNTAYILPTTDFWTLAVVNSAIMWWYAWRTAVRGKDEALRFIKEYVQIMPIATPNDNSRATVELLVRRLIEIGDSRATMQRAFEDWLKVELETYKPSAKLKNPIMLDSDGLVGEVKKIRGRKKPLSLAALRSLRDEYSRTIIPAQMLASEAFELERRIHDLVNEAYGLTSEDVKFLWETAPPRMPIPGP